MSDLVERLLKKDAWTNQRPYWHHRNPDGPEAAARITALETALAEARNEAFEEAAKACEAVLGGALEALSRAQDGSIAAVAVRGNVTAARYCAQAIRDMKDRT